MMQDITPENAFGNYQSKAEQPAKEFDLSKYLDVTPDPKTRTKTISIRLLPLAENGSPFLEVYGHELHVVPSPKFSNSSFKTFMCPTNNGKEEKCPICEINRYYWDLYEKENAKKENLKSQIEELKSNPTANAAQIAQLSEAVAMCEEAMVKYKSVASDHRKKKLYIVRCIVRGKESEGIKWWRFAHNTKGDGIYDKIYNLYTTAYNKIDPATGQPRQENILSLIDGYDIDVTINLQKGNNGKDNRVFLLQKGDKCPLAPTQEQMEAWVNEPTPWTDIYSTKSYDYLNAVVKSGGRAPIWDRDNKCYIPNIKAEEQTVSVAPVANPAPIVDAAPAAQPAQAAPVQAAAAEEEESNLPF